MKIEPETSNNIIPAFENLRLNNVQAFFPAGLELSDFEACLKELEEDKNNKDKQEIPPNQASSQAVIPSEQSERKNLSSIECQTKMLDKLFHIGFASSRNEGLIKELSKSKHVTKINLDDFKKEDIDFLKTCFENPSIVLNNINSQNFQVNLAIQNSDGQVSYKSFDVSKGLFNLIEYSFKAQKPVRLDFNGDSSVILKMNKAGKLTAEFISNDEAMAYVLKSSIPSLKNKLDSEGIPYEEIFYNDNKQNKNKRQNKGGSK
jgi:hypothetical protein